MARTDKKVELEQQPTSPIGRVDPRQGEAGFTLIEVVCVIAIIAILTAILLPALPRGTSRARLESFAVEMASLLKADRNAAVRRGMQVVTDVDAKARILRSGFSGHVVRVPNDVTFEATLAARCNQRPAGSTIRFFASGMSCGGTIGVTRLGVGYQVRVNWLTGAVEVAPLARL
jgi:general secretion pathway protein H